MEEFYPDNKFHNHSIDIYSMVIMLQCFNDLVSNGPTTSFKEVVAKGGVADTFIRNQLTEASQSQLLWLINFF